uniref:Cadherin domain-containing protein n=1 Tax=Macrostomum lignano TaxID=282301 RepID=A0A1I8FM55_9PLAT
MLSPSRPSSALLPLPSHVVAVKARAAACQCQFTSTREASARGWELASQPCPWPMPRRSAAFEINESTGSNAEMHCPNLPECRKSLQTCGWRTFDRPSRSPSSSWSYVIRDKNDNALTTVLLRCTRRWRSPRTSTIRHCSCPPMTDAGTHALLQRATLTRIVSISEPSRRQGGRGSVGPTRPSRSCSVGPGLDYGETARLQHHAGGCDRAFTTLWQHHHHCADSSPGRERQLAEVQPARVPPRTRVRVRLQIWLSGCWSTVLKATDADDGENGPAGVLHCSPRWRGLRHTALMAIWFLVGPPGSPSTSRVSDSGATPLSDHARVIIDVLDSVNDHAPEMSLQARSAAPSLRENVVVNGRFAVLRVSDGDLGDNGRVDCRLARGRRQIRHAAAPTASEAEIYARELHAADSRDRRVLDHGEPRRTVKQDLAIDHRGRQRARAGVSRHDSLRIGRCRAAGERIRCQSVDAATGTIRTLAPLDREAMTSFEGAQPVCVLDDRSLRRPAQQQHPVNVKIVDINDNAAAAGRAQHADPTSPPSSPSASSPTRTATSREHRQPPTSFRLLRTLRSPPGLNLNFTVDRTAESPPAASSTGRRPPQHLLMVALRNVGGPPVQETTATVTVRLRDLNDNPPRILAARTEPSSSTSPTSSPSKATRRRRLRAVRYTAIELALRRGSLHFSGCRSGSPIRNRLGQRPAAGGTNALAPGRHEPELAVTDTGAPAAHTATCSCRRSVGARLGAGWGSGIQLDGACLLIIVGGLQLHHRAASGAAVAAAVAAARGGDRRRRSKGGGASGSAGGGSGGGSRPTSRHGRWQAAAAAGGGGGPGSHWKLPDGRRRQPAAAADNFRAPADPDGGTLRSPEVRLANAVNDGKELFILGGGRQFFFSPKMTDGTAETCPTPRPKSPSLIKRIVQLWNVCVAPAEPSSPPTAAYQNIQETGRQECVQLKQAPR